MPKLNFANLIAHIVGGLIFLSSPLLFISKWSDDIDIYSILFSTGYLIFSFTYLSVFYLNSYLLIPALYLQKKFALYFLSIAFLLIIVILLKPFDHLVSGEHHQPQPNAARQSHPPPAINQPPSEPPPGDNQSPILPAQNDPISIFIFVMAIVLGLAIGTTSQLMVTEQRAANAEAEKANAELSFLKAQINPHFLFNTLNSIYALVIRKDDRAADSVVQLSELMRYIIRDANDDMVPLEKEIGYISNYIALQKSRLGDTVIINFYLKGNRANLKIAPMILISFIENAFKHGVNPDKNSKIEVSIAILDNNLRLYVYNRKTSAKNYEQGIGLRNTKERLQYLYPSRHELAIVDDKDSYSVHFLISL